MELQRKLTAMQLSTSSLPETHSTVNRDSVADISRARARCQARMKVVYNTSLSDGAVRLYMLLDDDSRWAGETWTGADTLARRMSVCERQVRRRFAELEDAGYITRSRSRHGMTTALAWANPFRTPERTNLSGAYKEETVEAVLVEAGVKDSPVVQPSAAAPPAPAKVETITAVTEVQGQLEHLQRSFPDTRLGRASPPDRELARMILHRIGGERYVAEFFNWVNAYQFRRRGRRPDRSTGPQSWGMLYRWATDFSGQFA